MRTLTLILSATLLAGCNYSQKDNSAPRANMGVVNSTCPFSGRPVAGGPVENYDGAQVGLCCNGCAAAWNKMTPEKKQEYIKSQEKTNS